MSLALVEPEPPADLLGPLLDGLERFCRAEVRALEIDRQAWIPNAVREGLAELGLFGVTLPAEHGGSGLTLGDACRLVAALARHDRAVATTVGLHLGLGTRGLVAYGTEAQHARYLPRLASGDAIAAFATTEPGAGSDLSALSTTAFVQGEVLKVQGQKIYVTNGGLAQLFTLTVSTPGLGGAAAGQQPDALRARRSRPHRRPRGAQAGAEGLVHHRAHARRGARALRSRAGRAGQGQRAAPPRAGLGSHPDVGGLLRHRAGGAGQGRRAHRHPPAVRQAALRAAGGAGAARAGRGAHLARWRRSSATPRSCRRTCAALLAALALGEGLLQRPAPAG